MVLNLSKKSLLALLPYFIQASATVSGSASGSGTTTRYWDCCKPSCAWSGKIDLASGATPVETCSIDDTPLSDDNATSGCDGGDAYMCSDNSPWAVSDDLAYGFAAVSISGGTESSWCCACYELTFTSTAIAGKKMIVQATNTGSDLSTNQFDINIPGGGVGIFNGCTAEWGAPSSGWGAQYGGISSASACATFPTALQPGCDWRYDWFEGADNPTVDFVQVECPAALTAKTGCVRAGEVPTGSSSVSTDAGSSATSSAVASSSTVVSLSSSSSAVAATTSSSSSSVATTTPILSSSSIAATTPTSSPISSAAATSTIAPSSSAAGVATSQSTFQQPTVASSAIRVPQESSASSAASSSAVASASPTSITSSLPTTPAVVSETHSKTTSLIMVTVTAKPGDPIPTGGSGADYCEL